MAKLTKFLGGTALAVLGATTASAGGMEVGRFNPAFMFEAGNYAEVSIAQTTPDVSDNLYSPDGSMLGKNTNFSGSLKLNINDRFSVGISTFDAAKINLDYAGQGGPFGSTPVPAAVEAGVTAQAAAIQADVTAAAGAVIAGGGTPDIAAITEQVTNQYIAAVSQQVVAAGITLPDPYVDLPMRSTVLTLNYKASDRIDVFGGVKYTEGSATGNVISNPAGDIDAKKGSTTSPIVGISYSIPDIALRVTATYQAKATTKHATTTSFPVAGTELVDTEASIPESFTLDFQTGIAANTLLFGSIHHAKWDDAHIYFDGSNEPKSTWDDSTTYSLGVGRKLNDNWSISGSFNYEAGGDKAGTSLLSPTNGVQGVSLGARYTRDNMSVSAGVNYSQLGDKDVTSFAGTGNFKDSSALTMGMKVGFSF